MLPALYQRLGLIAALACLAMAAGAHPLNRFFIDHSAALHVHPDRIELRHTLDYGDATTDPEVAALGYNLAAQAVTQASKTAYLESRVRSLPDRLQLLINGQRLAWTPIDASCSLEVMAGRAYPFIRLNTGFTAQLPALPRNTVVRAWYRDEVLSHRRGMKDIVVAAAHPDCRVLTGSLDGPKGLSSEIGPKLMQRRLALAALVPGSGAKPSALTATGLWGGDARDTRALTEELYAVEWNEPFPEDDEVRFLFSVGGTVEASSADYEFVRTGIWPENRRQPTRVPTGWAAWAEHRFEEIAQRSLSGITPGLLAAAFVVSFVFGAFHALSPGHGKTLVAAYLVGSKGTAWHAVYLGIVVTITHTGSVVLLAILAVILGQALPREMVSAWAGVVSGLLVIAIGFGLLVRRIVDYARGDVGHHHHHHHHEPHTHEHDHDHPTHNDHHVHHHGHSHHIPTNASWRDLLVLGIQGGLVPCPSALVVMLLGLSTFWSAGAWTTLLFTLSMIVVFSIGLAGVLITIGLLVVRATHLLQRVPRANRLTLALPIVSAVLIIVIGCILSVRGLIEAGVVSIHS